MVGKTSKKRKSHVDSYDQLRVVCSSLHVVLFCARIPMKQKLETLRDSAIVAYFRILLPAIDRRE